MSDNDNDNEKIMTSLGPMPLDPIDEETIASALMRIANSLEMIVQKPAWVKKAEKVVETANTVVAETPKVEKKKTDSEKQKPVSSTAKDALLNQTVKVTDGDPKNAGKTGVVTKVMRAWVSVQTEPEGQISVRPMHLEVIGDETGNPPVTDDEKKEVAELNTEISETDESTEPTEAEIAEVGPEPSDEPSDAGNYICTGGKHQGKTLYSLYQESSLGSKTVKWMARTGTNEEQQKAAQAYL